MRRILMAAAALGALSIPASVAVIGSSSQAFASSSLSCAKLKGTDTSTVTVLKCSPLTKAEKKPYKEATGSSTELATGGTLTWSGGTTTIISKPSTTTETPGACKTGDEEVIANGTVTGGTATVTHAGDSYSADICLDLKNGKVSLVKGTTFDL
jgi:hypothetical protein